MATLGIRQSLSCIVTGGCGFIGTHLCRALVNQGHSVRVLDLVPPKNGGVSGVEYFEGDVADLDAMTGVMKSGRRADAVFHLAAVASVPACEENPERSHRTNLVGTATVLEAIRGESRPGVRVIFSGSSAVYGRLGETGEALSETRGPLDPLSSYAAQKLGSEQLLREAYIKERLPSVIFRFFNVYGPGQDPISPYTGVISKFGTLLREGVPLPLHGGGSQTRDFVYVGDVVRACVATLGLNEDACKGEAINIASGKRVSVKQLAEMLFSVLDKSVPLKSVDPRPGDVLHSLGNISRAHEILGWSPEVSLETGLKSLFHLNKGP